VTRAIARAGDSTELEITRQEAHCCSMRTALLLRAEAAVWRDSWLSIKAGATESWQPGVEFREVSLAGQQGRASVRATGFSRI
jgi:hypothetical protein